MKPPHCSSTTRKHEVKLWNVVALLTQSSSNRCTHARFLFETSKDANSVIQNKLPRVNKTSGLTANTHTNQKVPSSLYIKIFLNTTLSALSKQTRSFQASTTHAPQPQQRAYQLFCSLDNIPIQYFAIGQQSSVHLCGYQVKCAEVMPSQHNRIIQR